MPFALYLLLAMRLLTLLCSARFSWPLWPLFG